MSQKRNEILSTFYHALRTVRRRMIIQILEESNKRTFTTRELAREITRREKDVSIQEATGEPYRNAYNALSQTHLPTLSDAGIIIYDPKRQTIQRGSNFALAALLLDTNLSMTKTIIALQEEPDED